MPKIKKILIANRGEIAVRIIRTCRERDIKTVAVYSEPDATALHVRMADEAYAVGPAASSESYLVIEKIIDAAKKSGADAVHPGYGFLSENAAFARACDEAGLTFIGPPIPAIEAMGDKTKARSLMRQHGVPMAPGSPDAIANPREAKALADSIGYPILIKAVAGGGGKGMRVVWDRELFDRFFEMAGSEAASAFGDGRVYIEKYIEHPRHIEFQVLADNNGNVVHLFERECSIQRRHQKVVEEAPSSLLTPEQRAAMGEASVTAAKAAGYSGAGTVEFLVDGDQFYFMEMNTRLQVEHPVTECITGLDLVAEQIRVAEGESLGYTQDDLSISGHAIECRVYAENPADGFLPSPGPLLRHRPPSGPGVRVDAGVDEGQRIEMFYDPMISKVISFGSTREDAIRIMSRALDEYEIAGVDTTIPFCQVVMKHPSFVSGDFSTRFVEEHFDGARLGVRTDEETLVAALAASLFKATGPSEVSRPETSRQQPAKWLQRRFDP